MKPGIYILKSKLWPEKVFIFRAVDESLTAAMHLALLKEGTHPVGRLQEHYDRYGADDLTVSLLFSCNKFELKQKEEHFIERFKPYFNGVDPVKEKKPIKVLVEDVDEKVFDVMVENAIIEPPAMEKAIIPEPKKTRKPRAKKKAK
jgi:hypothetical protein